MLTLWDTDRRGDRRAFLHAGTLGLGGLSLAHLLAPRASAAAPSRAVTGKSVILVFMHGGPSQVETFDPKMSAPFEIRSATGEIETRLPGVTFGSTFPKLAAVADKLAIVRSFVPGDSRHDIKPVVSSVTRGAALSSVYSRVVGTNNPLSGMPTTAALFPRAVDPSTQERNRNFGDFRAVGSFGTAHAPFVPGSGAQLQEDLRLHMPLGRLDDRRGLLARLDRVRGELDTVGAFGGLGSVQEQAFSTLLSGAADAFDLSTEDPKIVARYDTAPMVRPDQIDRKWNNYNHYVDNAKTLGKLLLLARRLCEAGVGFVTVTTNFVWDMHADVNNATMTEGMGYVGRPFDHALSTLVEDLHARGLSDDILVVACGEMGRTPRINARGGRDHWGNIGPLVLAGGGLQVGQVIGQSTRDASRPATTPYGIPHLVATIMHSLFDVPELRLMNGLPNQLLNVATAHEPIPGLLT